MSVLVQVSSVFLQNHALRVQSTCRHHQLWFSSLSLSGHTLLLLKEFIKAAVTQSRAVGKAEGRASPLEGAGKG